MKYTLDWLQQLVNTGQTVKYLFFWGHTPKKDGSIGKACFSQWWESGFTVDNTLYRSAEHWMMAEKARLFEDKEILNKILEAKSPGEAKKLGRKVRDFDLKVWNQHKYEIVKQGNLYKFGQEEELKANLLATKNSVLVEASPYDKIWGIGMKEGDAGIENPSNWKGENLLGFVLMEVRDELE